LGLKGKPAVRNQKKAENANREKQRSTGGKKCASKAIKKKEKSPVSTGGADGRGTSSWEQRCERENPNSPHSGKRRNLPPLKEKAGKRKPGRKKKKQQ